VFASLLVCINLICISDELINNLICDGTGVTQDKMSSFRVAYAISLYLERYLPSSYIIHKT